MSENVLGTGVTEIRRFSWWLMRTAMVGKGLCYVRMSMWMVGMDIFLCFSLARSDVVKISSGLEAWGWVVLGKRDDDDDKEYF